MSVKNILKHSNWIAINKQMVKLVGCNAAYMLGYLADKYDYFEGKNELNDGYFYATAADVEADIHLSGREQETAITRLAEQKIIETKLKGIPARRHFRFTDDAESILTDVLMCKTSFDKSAKLDTTKELNNVAQNSETIYKDLISKNNIKKVGSGDVPSLAPQQSYNDFLAANNFSRLAQTTFTLTDAQQQAAKIKHGEAGYLSTLTKLDDYLEKNPSYMQGKKDFNAVFRNFADNDDLSAAKIAWNAFFTAKHGQSYTKYSKADESALETILKHIKARLKEGDNIGDRIAGFFNALNQLPKYNEPMNCKLTFIANDYTNIVAHLGKQREAQKQAVPTLSPADAKEAAIKILAEIGLTDEMIGFIQSARCTDLQTAKNLTISQLFKAGKFDAANGERFNQCLKVLRPMLR